MLNINHKHRGSSSQDGNSILLALVVGTLLMGLAAAQFAVTQKNSQSANYFLAHSELRQNAESGVSIALHDLQFDVSGNQGKIGTVNWQAADDFGRDGKPSTGDEGEGDGLPTPGEPNVALASIGPVALDAGLMVYVADSGFADILRVVATASNQDAMVTVSTFVRKTVNSVPKVGAMVVDPDVILDLKGNKFRIDGNDHKPDGTPGSEPAVAGIATSDGDPAGTNKIQLLAQISPEKYDQVLGDGGSPSVDEAGSFTVDGLFNQFKALKTKDLPPDTYADAELGAPEALDVTYVGGDLHLTGQGKGAGVLVVQGSVTITGQLEYQGLVIVLGDVRLSGGGSGVHIYGSLMVGETFTAIDSESSEVSVSGNADIFYSSQALQKVEDFLGDSYAVVYYDDK